ncbi:MAG: bacillithiol biosynthesis deacetylase BshB1 [Saprospiraceae bacterium]
MKVDILAIGAHPDDIELSCAGTLIREIARGKTVGLLDLTQGELGSRGSAEIRLQEAAAAAEIIGAKFRKNLAMPDGYFEYSRENMNAIIQVIRYCQPEIVLANALDDRHPDHGRAAKLISDACFFSGLLKIKTADDNGKAQAKWRPRAVYHYVQDRQLIPDFVVDITDHIDQKMESILAYRSQFHLPDAKEYANEAKTPISGADFMEFIKSKNRVFGRSVQFDYAEGYQVGRIPAVDSIFDLI